MKRLTTAALLCALFLVCRNAANAAQNESEATVAVPGGVLHGSLVVPAGKGPFPVALIIAGSGATDRNLNGPGLHTDGYKLLAQALGDAGIASLRYDKRMIGASRFANYGESDARFDTLVGDAVAWLRQLKADPRFSRVSVIGHSEGSLIGMLAAQQVTGLDAYVSLAGSGYSGGDILLRQIHARSENAPIYADSDRIIHALQSGKPADVPASPPVLTALFRPSLQPYLISWFHYEPVAEIAKVKNRTLIVQGSHDVQISLDDAQRLHAALPASKLAIIEGMNHVLRDAPADFAGNIATYTQPDLPLDAMFVQTLTAFLNGPA